MNLIINVEHEQRGQPGNYQPHTYRSRLEFISMHPWDLPHEEAIRDLVRVLVHPYTEEPPIPGNMASHFQPRLTMFERIAHEDAPALEWGNDARRTVYRVEVQEPYCD